MLKKLVSAAATTALLFTFLPVVNASAHGENIPAPPPGNPSQISHQAVIYEETVSQVLTNNRYWPTVNLWRKIGTNQPELLAQVGKVGEYPSDFILSPDKQKLLINLESKLQLLDLSTKKLEDIFTPTKSIESVIFSQDGKKLLIWDQNYSSVVDFQYSVHRFDLATKQDQVIKQGDTHGKYFSIDAWRSDDKVLLSEAGGEASSLWIFDVNTGALRQATDDRGKPIGPVVGMEVSPKGNFIALVDRSITDVCNSFSNEAASTYNLLDPVTGATVGTFGDPVKAAEFVGFSASENALVFRTYTPWNDEKKCDQKPSSDDFLYIIPNHRTAALPNSILDWAYRMLDLPAFQVNLDPKFQVEVKYHV